MTGFAFICDAHARTGFGHAARCLQVAHLIRRRLPEAEIEFQGEFSAVAERRLRDGLPRMMINDAGGRLSADVALIDRMSDFEDVEICDMAVVERVRSQAGRCCYLASGQTAPNLPQDVLLVGYQPGGPSKTRVQTRWGWEFAPADRGLLEGGLPQRAPDNALVAFGGALNARAPDLALAALARMDAIRTVDVLLSPVAPEPATFPLRPDQSLTLHRNVPSVGPLLAHAGVVLASFGNLGYEALALGAPLCLINTKVFQDVLGGEFQRNDVAVNVGIADSLDVETIEVGIARTLGRAGTLSENARRLVDGRGLERLADILVELSGG